MPDSRGEYAALEVAMIIIKCGGQTTAERHAADVVATTVQMLQVFVAKVPAPCLSYCFPQKFQDAQPAKSVAYPLPVALVLSSLLSLVVLMM